MGEEKATWQSWDEGRAWIENRKFGLEEHRIKDLAFRKIDGGPILVPNQGGQLQPRRLLGNAGKELSRIMGMSPNTLFKITDEDLRDKVALHLLEKGLDGRNLFVASSGDTVRGVFKSPDEYMDPNKVFDRTHDVVGDDGGIADLSYVPTSGAVRMSVVSTDCQEPPKREGDLSHAGLSLSINGGVEISPFVYRLVCLNGLIAERTVACHQVLGLDELQQVLEWSKEELQKFIDLDEVKIENPSQVVTRASREVAIPDRATRNILEQLPTLGDKDVTAYDLVNLVTQMARDRGHSFENYGGRMMNVLHRDRCSHCGAAVLSD